MDVIGCEPGAHLSPLRQVVGAWYLKGFADAYAAHWAAAPAGVAGEHYRRGYALGIAAVRDQYFAALNLIGHFQAAVPLEC